MGSAFPFGERALPREPRRPVGATCAYVLGVYPSALHIRWRLPSARPDGLRDEVTALAVADEPTVFWDGSEADRLVEEWKDRVGFRTGDADGDDGHASANGNGTSGRGVATGVLAPLGISPASTWFNDAVDTFYVKHGGRTAQQGDVMRDVYDRFAASRPHRSPFSLPRRPSPTALVDTAVRHHRERLRLDLIEAASQLLVTLGEEARRVLAAIADLASGPATVPLSRGDSVERSYGRRGEVFVDGRRMDWLALKHPGNSDPYWTRLHDEWVEGHARDA